MEYQKLGQTDLKISRIGFGCYPMGGYGWGKVNDEDFIKAVRKALESGVNIFDTADVYGLGHSEELLSKALGKNKNNVVIATKFGVRWNKNENRSYYDCSRKWIIEAVEGSLRRLDVDCISLYQIHYADSNTSPEETMSALKELQTAGKIKYIGCSNYEVDSINELQKFGRVESIQLPFNIIDRNSKTTFSEASNEHRMTGIAYSPLAQGLLTGKYRSGTKFAPDDMRSRSKYFQNNVLDNIDGFIYEMDKIGSKHKKTMAQVALRWILDAEFQPCAIVGIKTEKQIIDAAGASDWSLQKDEIDAIIIASKKIQIPL